MHPVLSPLSVLQLLAATVALLSLACQGASVVGETKPTTSATTAAATALTAALADDEFDCSLYLAPSSKSTSEEFKWGIYTAVTLQMGDMIGHETLAIPMYNFRANNRRPPSSVDGDSAEYWDHMVTHVLNFMWQAEMGGAADEQEADETTDPLATCLAMPGMGMSAAFDSPSATANADWDVFAAYHRASSSLPSAGTAHAGRGATTQFDQVTLRALRTIRAGSEVIIAYDDASTPSNEADENAITEDDYAKMDETISQMVVFFDKHASLEDSAKQQIYQFLIEDFMEAAVGNVKAQKVAELMPLSPADLKAVQTAGGIRNYANSTESIQKQRFEWLRRTGYCLSDVRPAPSAIPNAGLGAFATHRLHQGSVIAPIPVVHIPNVSSLNMFDLTHELRCLLNDLSRVADESTGIWSRDPDSPLGTQLLINYVFGHPDSTLVFLPTSSAAAFMNHHHTPNARLRWADGSRVGHSNTEWMKVSPTDMVESDKYYTVGLLMEAVALRDIDEGEEITLDYGSEWVSAWEKHQSEWPANAPKVWPLRAADLNARHSNTVLPTEEEMVGEEAFTYPDDVTLKAFIVIDENTGSGVGTATDPYQYAGPDFFAHFSASNLFAVEITKRYDAGKLPSKSSPAVDSYAYTVRVEYGEETSYVSGVPHRAFVFVDNPETGDQFSTEVKPFRHSIGIPDDVFPKGPWRNK